MGSPSRVTSITHRSPTVVAYKDMLSISKSNQSYLGVGPAETENVTRGLVPVNAEKVQSPYAPSRENSRP